MKTITKNDLSYGFVAILCGMIARLILVSIITYFPKGRYNLKERTFMAMAWVPKATVQAALCSVILTDAKNADNEVMIGYGQTINTLAIFAILITAPFGATFISTFGPKFLEKAESKVGPELP